MKRFSRLSIVSRTALLALVCALPTLPAQAGAYTFSNPNAQRTINAGIVLLDSTTNTANTANTTNTAAGPDNPDPYVFYILSRRVDLLPVGWTIKNPLSSHNVSADVQNRWDARTRNSTAGTTFESNNGGHAYQFGQNITPSMAAYWEVSMNGASTQDLQQFDVLLVNLANGDIAKFRPSEVEKLRRFVDGGGTLLVEDSGKTISTATVGGRITDGTGAAGTFNAYGPLFFPLQYANGAAGTAQLPNLANRHPIISAPYYLAQNELNALGNGFMQDYISTAGAEFASVLADTNNKSVLAANTYGAGAVVVSSTGAMAAINDAVTAGSIDAGYGPNSGPYCGTNFQAAPTQDLKFLCNIISWVGGHSHEHQNSHQTGETLSALPSPVRSWNYQPLSAAGVLLPTGTNAPGATISGNFVYSMDAAGNLHAFDLYPYEDLDGDGKPDDGLPDYNIGNSYDEVWNVSLGPGASAATIATPPTMATSVFVEGKDGKINQYEATKGTAGSPFGGPAAAGSFSASIPGTNLLAPAPAPTYYEGRLYASEPDGTLFIKDFTTGRSASGGVSVKLDATTTPLPTGAPLVGAVGPTGPSSTTPQTTDIVAMVPTNAGLYSLFLGARGEQLTGAAPTFIASHAPNTATIDANAKPPLRVYSLTMGIGLANAYANLETIAPSPSPPGRTFSGTPVNNGPPPPAVFADYDVDFANSTSLTRTVVAYGGNGVSAGTMSTPALDRFGNAYYFASEPSPATAYTVLTSFHDAQSGPRLPWRFRLPVANTGGANTAITDADGTDYSRLGGFQFQGKPVVDSRGFVYALASNATGTQTAILCFDGQAAVTTAPLGIDAGSASFSQTEFGVANPILSNQYTQSGTGGPLTFSSFGATSGAAPATLVPNLNEPEPLTATLSQQGNTGGGVLQVLLHTNMAWYSILQTNVTAATANTLATGTPIIVTPGEGLTKVGNALFFVGGTTVGGATNLYSVPADPQAAGYTIANKYVDALIIPPNGTSFVTDNHDTGVGATSAVASGANGALIVNGTNGVSAFLNRTTLVTDSSRVMEINQDGSAAWLADSTQGNIGLGTTSLELNRPSSITELNPNDYLVADTGNNRVVRFDRAGKVVWELSRFSDTYQDALTTANYGKAGPLLSASEPNTLNQPTSVQIRQAVETIGTAQYNVVHYLVSDTGNFRILDIVDVYDANGQVVGTPHNLVWISHTHDKQQRQYRYQSAAYFNAPNNTTTYVVALITNQRVGPLSSSGALGSATQDAPGGSLVLLGYDPTTPTTNGYIATVIDHFQAYLTNNGAFDLTTALANAGAKAPVFTGTPTTLRTLYIRNPRFLKAYTPAGSTSATKGPNLLLADDNGVFDLAYDAGTTGAGARPPQYFTQWGFTQTDYQLQANNPITSSVPYNRGIIPFVPQSIQRTTTDTVTFGANSYSIGRYLVTNGYSQGNASSLNDKPLNATTPSVSDLNGNAFGGEVFELAVPSIPTGGTGPLATTIVNALGRISNSSPLVQPTFAYRLQ